jgi:hypothetical protein
MHRTIDTREEALAALGNAAFMRSLSTRPTFVTIKAHWCPHCVVLKQPLAELVTALKSTGPNTGINSVIIELDAFAHLKSTQQQEQQKHQKGTKPDENLFSELHRRNSAANGVPYIAMILPRVQKSGRLPHVESFQVAEFRDGKRDALQLARFIDGVLRSS